MYGYKYYHFSLNISADELKRVYAGFAHKLVVRTDEGIVLELDANHLRSFTTIQGIKGRFVLCTSSANKFVSLKKEV